MEIANVAIGLTGPWKSTLRQQIDIQVRCFPGRANHLRPDEGSGPVHGGGIGLRIVYFLDETIFSRNHRAVFRTPQPAIQRNNPQQ
jgi:hypothetical protein